jgi:hypothetical protein
MAVDLYEDAKLMPGASTGRHLRTQHGLVVNGPLFPNPAEGPACLLYAAQNGRPCVVKMLDGHVLPGESGSPGGTEARAVRYVWEDVAKARSQVSLSTHVFQGTFYQLAFRGASGPMQAHHTRLASRAHGMHRTSAWHLRCVGHAQVCK